MLERFVWGEQLELTPAGLRLQIRSSWGDGELRPASGAIQRQ
jgi:hypothetical protein